MSDSEFSPDSRPNGQSSSNGSRQVLLRHSFITLALLCALIVVGSAGYRVLEHLSVIDAIYMTVITITTVGYGEIPHPFSTAGRLFTVALIFGGVSVAAYALTSAAQYVVSAEWQTRLADRKRRHMLEELHNHIIVCGYGRVGTGVVHELLAERLPFVVIELDEAMVSRLREMGHLALHGNAANEILLQTAGIARAQGIVVCASSDAENVYITLTARELRPDINIVARASYEESKAKLLRAGANRVIMPFGIAGRRMVAMLVRPDVADFIDIISSASGLELFVEQVNVAPGSKLVGQTLGQADLSAQLGVSVLAVHSPGRELATRPDPSIVLAPLTKLIVLGTRDQLLTLMGLSGHTRGDVAEPLEDLPPLPS